MAGIAAGAISAMDPIPVFCTAMAPSVTVKGAIDSAEIALDRQMSLEAVGTLSSRIRELVSG